MTKELSGIKQYIFSDAATSSQKGIAIGAFVCLEQQTVNQIIEMPTSILVKHLEKIVVYTQFESKKSTYSEIKTIITALKSIQNNLISNQSVEIYTDCQSICDLLGRRKKKLEKNNFMTRSGKTHSHADLYKDLYSRIENVNATIFKVKGHQEKSTQLTWQEKVFCVLDKLSRKKLRSLQAKY